MSDEHRVRPDFTTVALVGCAIVGLVLVAAALPPLTGGGHAEAPSATNPIGDITTDDGTTVTERDASGSDDGEADDGLALRLSDADPVPGTNLTVTVLDDGDPVEGATVLFDGEEVGVTDEDGHVRAEVPFVEEVTVAATTGEVSAALADAPGDRTAAAAAADDGTLAETVATDSDLSIDLDGGLYPSGEATVTVTVGDDQPVEDATITSEDGIEVTTDEKGTASVDIPDDAASLVVEARRGELSADERVPLDLDARVGSTLFPFALGSASVEATAGDDYAITDEDVTVYVVEGAVDTPDDADRSGATDETSLTDSPTPVRLPVASSATIVVEAGDSADAVVVDNLLRNLGLLVLGGASVTYGTVVTYVRILGRSPSRDVERVGWSLRLGAINLGAFVQGIARTYSPLGAAGHLFSRIGDGIAATLHAIATLRVPSPSIPSLPPLALPALSMPSLPSLSSVGLLSRGATDDPSPDPASESTTRLDAADPARPDVPEQADVSNRELITAAWYELAETSGVDDIETTTPGAVARAARSAGVSETAVDVLTTAFRRIEYGGAEPTDDRTERALKALAVVRATGGDGE